MNELEAINQRLAEIEDEKRQLLQRKQQLQQPFSKKPQTIPRFSTDQKVATAQVVVATGKYVGEGFDLPRLDTLFFSLADCLERVIGTICRTYSPAG